MFSTTKLMWHRRADVTFVSAPSEDSFTQKKALPSPEKVSFFTPFVTRFDSSEAFAKHKLYLAPGAVVLGKDGDTQVSSQEEQATITQASTFQDLADLRELSQMKTTSHGHKEQAVTPVDPASVIQKAGEQQSFPESQETGAHLSDISEFQDLKEVATAPEATLIHQEKPKENDETAKMAELLLAALQKMTAEEERLKKKIAEEEAACTKLQQELAALDFEQANDAAATSRVFYRTEEHLIYVEPGARQRVPYLAGLCSFLEKVQKDAEGEFDSHVSYKDDDIILVYSPDIPKPSKLTYCLTQDKRECWNFLLQACFEKGIDLLEYRAK